MVYARRGYGPGDEPIPGYRLTGFLGRGHFGEVWQAVGPGGMEVALKIIDLTGPEGIRELEAVQSVRSIHHPNLLPLFASWLRTQDGQIIEEGLTGAIGASPETDSLQEDTEIEADEDHSGPLELTELILAMGLGSKSLYQRLEECRKEGNLAIARDELLDYIEDAAKGIDYLNEPIHDLGSGPVPVIHGDIKPHNLLIVGNAVQVCDFGLARAVETLRKTTTAMGTCAYAAPELLYGKPHPNSDQYCLAITYIELRTGLLPFEETNPFRVADLHKEGNLDLSRLDAAEAQVISKATAVDPTSRWPSCSAMVRSLRRACETGEVDLTIGKPRRPRRKPTNMPTLSSTVGDKARGTLQAPSATDAAQSTLVPAPAEEAEKASTGELAVAMETLPFGQAQPEATRRRRVGLRRLAMVVLLLSAVAGIAFGADMISGRGVLRGWYQRVQSLFVDQPPPDDDGVTPVERPGPVPPPDNGGGDIEPPPRDRVVWLADIQRAWKVDRDWQKACGSCTDLLEHFPECVEAKLIRARALVQLGEFEAALLDLNTLQAPERLPEKLRPLHLALMLVAERSLQRLDPADVPDRIAMLSGLRSRTSPPEFWDLSGTERSWIEDVRREGVATLLQQIGTLVETRRLPDAQERLQLAGVLAAGPSEKQAVKLWNGVVESIILCRHPQPAEDEVKRALDALGQLLSADNWPLSLPVTRELCAALGEVSHGSNADSAPVQELDRAIGVVRIACARFPLEKGIAMPLGRLWERRIAIRVRGPDSPSQQEFDRLELDWKRAETAGARSALVDAYRAECLTVLGRGGRTLQDLIAKADEMPADLPADLIAYGHYVRALAMRADPAPDWEAIVRELAGALPAGDAPPEILAVQNRMPRLAAAIVEAAQTQRNRMAGPARLDRLPDNPFPDDGEYFRLLECAHRFGQSELDAGRKRELTVSLALAALYKPDADLELARTLTAELVKLGDGELGSDAIAILYACVRSRSSDLQTVRARPEERRVVVGACTRLLRLFAEGDRYAGTLTDETAARLYREIVRPARSMADVSAEAVKQGSAGATAAAELDEFYGTAGRFIWDHRYAGWPFEREYESKQKAVENFFSWAIYLHGKRAQDSQNRDLLAEYHLKRGLARVQQVKPSLEDVRTDASAAFDLRPDLHGAHGLLAHYYLVRSRNEATSREDRVATLTEAIESGKTAAVKCRQAGDPVPPSYLVNVSSAYVERANFLRDPAFQKQKADLELALKFATDAENLKQGHPDYPYLSMGNAYEDLAWLVEHEPETNYKNAIDAFRRASNLKLFSSVALWSIGRCYYRSATATRVDPKMLGMRDRDELIAECRRVLERADNTLDPNRVQIYYYLALAAQYRRQYREADDYFQKAKSLAAEQHLPTLAVYATRWARFPLQNADLEPQQQYSLALQRARELLQGVPVPPASSTDPVKEEAWIRAEVHVRKKEFADALAIYDHALPENLSQAKWSDVGLLLARARCKLALLGSSEESTTAEAVIADALRAAELAIARGNIALAHGYAAQARYKMYERTGSASALDRAVGDIREAARLTARQPSGKTWRMWGVRLLVESLQGRTPEQKGQVVADALQWQNECIRMQEDDIRMTGDAQRRRELTEELERLNRERRVLENLDKELRSRDDR